jgi:riboflavin biosynthesis pyrimidine reductase
MRLLHPSPGPDHPLDDAALAALYPLPPGGTPALRVNFVTSLDGAVTVGGLSEGLSSPADKAVFGLLRGLADAVMVAAGTLRNEEYGPVVPSGPRRAARVAAGRPEYPVLVVVSGSLDLDPAHRSLAEAPVRPIIVTHGRSPADRREALSAVADVLVADDGQGRVDLATALDALAGRGLAAVLCEGGPHLFSALIAAGRVDELCLTVSPLLAGGGPGRISAGSPLTGPPPGFRLVHIIEDESMLLLRYTRVG